ncbi:putative phage abortive infection protein [Pseudomonas anatoliensis]|uniref:putative phage abortive infection protein n=1 Tax=Pseudomonas anatoliensis TaxID=2710589 RepID=UPI001B327CD9|nr:putative phage abortive infection protein [Pseudomonas anatoliensis]MBP5958155.1 putative phage abortive infection protein [Pseudomonas anatoliensis]
MNQILLRKHEAQILLARATLFLFADLMGVTMWIKRLFSTNYLENDVARYIADNVFFVCVSLLAFSVCTLVFGALFLHFFLDVDIPNLAIENHETASYWGQLGDFAGGFLNPLLSFLALMAVLKTMALQRAEMKATQQEAKIATEEQRQQTAVYSRQMFESTLFGMLDVHAKILGDIKSSDSSYHREGRDAVDVIVRNFKESDFYKEAALHSEMMKYNDVEVDVSKFYKDKISSVGHYFRNLYWIMKMIDSSENALTGSAMHDRIVKDNKEFYADYVRKRNYTNIVRAQLSESEMALLQINCLGSYGADLKYYVEKYSLLKPLGKEYFGSISENMCRHFNKLAFLGLEKIKIGELVKIHNNRVRRVSEEFISKGARD